MNLELSKEQQIKLNKTLEYKKQTLEEYLTSLVVKDIDGKYLLGKGFYYDIYSDKLFNENQEEISLTNIQKSIILYLIQNNTRIVSAENLYKNCWNTKDKFSIYTVRNMIKQIRDKTYYDIFKSNSNIGYSIYPN